MHVKLHKILGSRSVCPHTAVQRRLKTLRESGVIEKEIAVLHPTEDDNYILIIVKVMLVQGGTSLINAFKEKVKNYSEVQQCYYVAGENDFILVIAAKKHGKRRRHHPRAILG